MPIRLATSKDIPDISRIYTQVWNSTYQGLLPDAFLKAIQYPIAEKTFQESFQSVGYSYFVLLAEKPEGQIVGYLDGGRDRENKEVSLGEIYGMYLQESYQGQGLGMFLLEEAFQRFRSMGWNQARTWVLREGKARGFYEKAGGKLGGETKKMTLGADSMNLVSYRWNL